MEAHMGYEFGNIRIKADTESAGLCHELGARAFTYGGEIWMGRGESVSDFALMAHELAHVVQQGNAVKMSPESRVERVVSGIKLADRLRVMRKLDGNGTSLYRTEIQRFQQHHTSQTLARLQSQILESPATETLGGTRGPAGQLSMCGGGTGGAAAPTVPAFPTMTVQAADGNVEAARAADWAAGMGDFLERAGWVMWDSTANTFSVVNRVTGNDDGVNPGATPPDSGASFCVGHYHQHPPLRPGRDSSKFPVGPSGADRGFATSRNNPGIVRDFTDTTRTVVTDYQYGPSKRA
jgi:hypothetical protein